MPSITLTPPVAGQDADAGPIATAFSALQTLLNGQLDATNISAVGAVRGADVVSKWKIISGSNAGNTDGSGNYTFNFGVTFSVTPIVIYVNGDSNAPWTDGGLVFASTNTTQAMVKTSVISGPVRVNWIALGYVA